MRLPLQSAPIIRGVNRGTVAHYAASYAINGSDGTFPCVCDKRTKNCKKTQTCRCNDGMPVCS